MLIRIATNDDVPVMVEMGVSLLTSKYPGKLAINRVTIEETARTLVDIEQSNLIAYMAEDDDGTPVGMIGICRYPHPLSGETVGSELCFWVNDGARGGAAAGALLDMAEAWWSNSGCDWWQMIAPDERVEHLYQRRKMVKIETMFQKKRGV